VLAWAATFFHQVQTSVARRLAKAAARASPTATARATTTCWTWPHHPAGSVAEPSPHRGSDRAALPTRASAFGARGWRKTARYTCRPGPTGRIRGRTRCGQGHGGDSEDLLGSIPTAPTESGAWSRRRCSFDEAMPWAAVRGW
jgi:hypothetical protein